jgi:hypothetical protein
MKIIDPHLSFCEIFNPLTGEVIVDSIGIPELDCESFIADWTLDCSHDPYIKDPGLETAWSLFMQKHNEKHPGKEPDFQAVEDFLLSYESDEWKVIRINNSPYACTMAGTVAWFVVDNIIDFESIV